MEEKDKKSTMTLGELDRVILLIFQHIFCLKTLIRNKVINIKPTKEISETEIARAQGLCLYWGWVVGGLGLLLSLL